MVKGAHDTVCYGWTEEAVLWAYVWMIIATRYPKSLNNSQNDNHT